jgi:Arc/MetJ family transcription regulator
VRIDVVLDDDLVESALRASGLKTQREAIEEGLKLLINVHTQKRIRASRGTLKWSGNLDRMRRDKR